MCDVIRGEHWHDNSGTAPSADDVTPPSTGGAAGKDVAVLEVVELAETAPRSWTHRFSIAHTTMPAAIRATPIDIVTPTVVSMLDDGLPARIYTSQYDKQNPRLHYVTGNIYRNNSYMPMKYEIYTREEKHSKW